MNIEDFIGREYNVSEININKTVQLNKDAFDKIKCLFNKDELKHYENLLNLSSSALTYKQTLINVDKQFNDIIKYLFATNNRAQHVITENKKLTDAVKNFMDSELLIRDTVNPEIKVSKYLLKLLTQYSPDGTIDSEKIRTLLKNPKTQSGGDTTQKVGKLFAFFNNIKIDGSTYTVTYDNNIFKMTKDKLDSQPCNINNIVNRKLKKLSHIITKTSKDAFRTVMNSGTAQAGGEPPPTKEVTIVKDVEEIRNLTKNIEKINRYLAEVGTEWETYKTTVPPMNFKDPLFTDYIEKVKELLLPDKDGTGNNLDITKYPNDNNRETSEIKIFINNVKQQTNTIAQLEIYNNANVNNTKNITIKYDPSTESQTIINYEYMTRYIARAKLFKDSLKILVSHVSQKLPELHNNADKLNCITAFINSNTKYIKDFENEKTATVRTENDSEPKCDNKSFYNDLNTYLKHIQSKFADANADTYTDEDIIKIKSYFQSDSGKNLVKRISDKFDSAIQESEKMVKSILTQSKKYADTNKQIQIKILENLEPKELTGEPYINITSHINKIREKMVFDINTMMNTFLSRTVGNQQKQRGGDPTETKKREEGSLRNIITKNRTETDELMKKHDDFNKLKTIHSELFNNMIKLKNPSDIIALGNTTYESLFTRLYNKYIEDKTINKKSDYVAAEELLSALKENNLLSKEVLKVDLRDKVVFIFTSLFLRLFSIYIIEALIDRKVISKLDNAVFGFLGIYTAFFILLIIIVNTDTYKLRIIYNYVNLHSDPTNIFTYISLLWLFGAIVYFIMYNINQSTIIIASNDDERAKLKYKMQVISMLIWLYVSVAIIAM